ncbi:MAG: cyanophycinase [Planctomycetota bacterium]|nr:cyanophycinase [Planctomycetota bacterium]
MTRMRLAFYAMGAVAAIGAGLGGRGLAWLAAAPAALRSNGIVPKGGSLLICGGGRLPDEVRRRFLELAGGSNARIVVIPTALRSADAPETEQDCLKPWRDLGAKSVTMLHTRDRSRAGDPRFLAPLRAATGVWMVGGHQSRLAAAYGGTEVERQLKALADRGGVVGGTSAGAAIMTRVMLVGEAPDDPFGRGFDLLEGAIIDQHFLKRRHLKRLIDAMETHPGLLGFGIDEGTALLVRGNRLSVLGDSYVVACLPGPGKPASPKVEILRSGDEADLTSLRGPTPRIVPGLNIDDGLSTGE